MPPKLNHSFVKAAIEALGNYELKTQTYEGSTQKLEILCKDCDKTMTKSFPDFKKNQCADCGRAKANDKKRTPISEVQSFIHDNGSGDELKSKTYVNKSTPIQVECGLCHKDYPVTFVNFKHHGGRCKCRQQRVYHTFDTVSAFIKGRGDEIISTEYKTMHDLLKIRCGKCKDEFPMTYHYYHDEGRRCKCYSIPK